MGCVGTAPAYRVENRSTWRDAWRHRRDTEHARTGHTDLSLGYHLRIDCRSNDLQWTLWYHREIFSFHDRDVYAVDVSITVLTPVYRIQILLVVIGRNASVQPAIECYTLRHRCIRHYRRCKR